MHRITIVLLTALLFSAGALEAQRPLDHDAYDIWKAIDDESISRDGRWVVYSLTLQQGDAELRVHGLTDDAQYTIPRGRAPRFSADSRFVAFTIKPEDAAVREARRAKKRGDDLPKDSLGILDLATGAIVRVARVRSFGLPEEAGGWLAYLLERGERQDTASVDSAATPSDDSTAVDPKKASETGTVLVLRRLPSGDERQFEHVTEYRFTEDGQRLAFALSSRLGEADGVVVLDLSSGDTTRIVGNRATYRSLALDEAGNQIAFLTTRDDVDADEATFALYSWRVGEPQARALAGSGTDGIASGWVVSEDRAPSFSDDGQRLFFGTAPYVAPVPEDSTPDDERVRVDIWNWRDPVLQPQQLLQANRERRRNYLAVVHLEQGRVVQLADQEMPTVQVSSDHEGELVIGESDLPYRQLRSWDSPGYSDVYLVDLRTGSRTKILERVQANVTLSPDGSYAAWYDNRELAWFTRSTDDGRVTNVSAAIPYPLYDEEHDTPSPARSYGSAGWTDDGDLLLIYDRHDIWALDPEGQSAPRNVTEGVGRRENLRFRYVRLDREERGLPPQASMLLAAFNYDNKQDGFYRDRVRGNREPERLLFMERDFSTPVKAKDADRLLFTRASVEEFPDLWVADLDFGNAQRVSQANPQQSEYRWATAELVEWLSADGVPLQGLLYKPDDFDPAKKYPMMVYFYERSSQGLYSHSPPIPHRSVIRPTFYASRGYLVFMPDIVYRTGYPGQGALDAVIPGVLEIVRRGFVDQDRIGVQGHSWGGYQIAFLVTRTNIFRAAAAGAVVANMTSAYGGIRWATGLSRMFQYERTQSRLGASLWEAPMRYLENSPLFWADRVETPLLMMHNDEDGAVPWEQGIEMFTALRRLGKPVWMVTYNGEPHWPTTYANKRDWNIRLQQYFDHYLMDAPAPRWLAEGVPATEKGRTLGLDLIEEKGR